MNEIVLDKPSPEDIATEEGAEVMRARRLYQSSLELGPTLECPKTHQPELGV